MKPVLHHHTLVSGLVLVCLIVLPAGRLTGQDASGLAVYEEQLRLRLDEQLPEVREVGFDAGGWFSFALFNYDDGSASKHRMLRQYQLRVWARVNIRGVHQFYVRGLLDWEDWNSGDNPDTPHDDEFFQRIERAWYQFDLGQMLRQQTGKAPPFGLKLKVGRAYARIGTALVLSMPLDLIQLDVSAGDWDVKGFLGTTIRHRSNIDRSFAVSEDQERCLWGIEVAYNGLDRHRPFAYFMSNYDRTTPDPRSATQRYDYTSHYIGLGSVGTILSPNLRYSAEIVGEYGKTFSDGAVDRQDRISAMAIDVMLEYLFKTKTSPRLSFEYLFGSGDNDRSVSAVSTVGGNQAGTTDHAFNAFGFRDTGIAFSPDIANLHTYILGASFFPLEDHDLFRRLEVGTKAFFYHKATNGAISDTTGTNSSRWVGWEWDVYCDWRITSDLTWTIRYGAFQPRSAFSDRSCRQFLYTAVSYSF